MMGEGRGKKGEGAEEIVRLCSVVLTSAVPNPQHRRKIAPRVS